MAARRCLVQAATYLTKRRRASLLKKNSHQIIKANQGDNEDEEPQAMAMTERKPIAQTAWKSLTTGFLVVFGITLRLAHVTLADMTVPFLHGGLFVEFAEQIAANHYLLPRGIPFYTDGGIPFAYPPLPFYVEALLLETRLPKFAVANLLPLLIAALTVPSFYVLTRQLKLDWPTQTVSLLAYATMPVAFRELIEAAGLAEAFGTLFVIWLAMSLVWARARGYTLSGFVVIGLCWAACIVSSPGSAYASVLVAGIFAALELPNLPLSRALRLLVIPITTACVFSSPYWLTVTANYGVRIFTGALAGEHSDYAELAHELIRNLLGVQVVTGSFSLMWNALTLFGILCALARRDRWLFPAWFGALLSVPREGQWLVALPAALLAGVGGGKVAKLTWGYIFEREDRLSGVQRVAVVAALVGFALVGAIGPPVLAIKEAVEMSRGGLSAEAMAAMEWVSENTPAHSKIIVVARSQVVEWFPQLARRTVLNVVFGTEWEPGKRRQLKQLEREIARCSTLGCLYRAAEQTFGESTYLVCIERQWLSKLLVCADVGVTFESLWENEEMVFGMLKRQ